MQYSGVDVGLACIRFCIALSPWISPAADYRAAKIPLPLLITQGTMQRIKCACLNPECMKTCVFALVIYVRGT